MKRSMVLTAFLGAVWLAAAAPSAFGAPAPAPAGAPAAVATGAPAAAATAAPAPEATPFAVVGDAARGRRTFKMFCSMCHGLRAQGFVGPWIGKDNANPEDLRKIVRNGIEPYGGMPRFTPLALTEKNIDDILAYLLTVPLDPN